MKLKGNHLKPFLIGKTKVWLILLGLVIGIVALRSGKAVVRYTSTDAYCTSCHIHPMADQSWKLSTHFNNPSGNIIHCSECHLPPEGQGYLFAKAKHGAKDIYGSGLSKISKIE